MTTYNVTATATTASTNIITVDTVINMVSGMPIVFTGTAFGGIVAGSTYYIKTIVQGFPGYITVSGYPNGATFTLTTATGSMVGTFNSAGQQVINTGAMPNDGTGDPLRTAFNDTNLNFDQIFAAGPVLSNIQIANNSISTLNTNGNLILNPNGVGVVQPNSHVIPDSTRIRNLGSSTKRWNNVYTQYVNVAGDATVGGNLSVAGNVIEVGNIVTDSLTIQLANTATNASAANGAGIVVGVNQDLATFLFDSGNNAWATNIGLEVNGSISGTDLSVSNATVYGNVGALYGNFTGNVSANYFIGDGSHLTGISTSTNKIFNGDSWANIDSSDGNLVVNINGPQWTFNNDSSLSLPAGNLAGLGNVVGPGNILYPFGPGPVLLADGSANNSAYFSLVAVANAEGVLGYMGPANFGGNASTGLVETSDGTGNVYNWYFQNDGTTAFPNYTFPNVDGATGQVFATDGSGTIYWANSSSYGNSNVVSLLADFGNNSISTTGTITANTVATQGTGGDIVTTGGNITGANVINANTITGNGNLYLQPDANSAGAYLDVYLTTGPDIHIAGNGENVIIGRDGTANVTVNTDGNVTIQSWNGTANTWTFDNTGIFNMPGPASIGVGNNGLGIATPGNIFLNNGAGNWTFDGDGELTLPSGGRLGYAGKGWTGLDGGNGNPVSFTSFYANGFYAGCITNNNDGNIIISTYTGDGLQGNWTFDNGANLVLAPTNQEINGAGSGESAKLRGTRKIVNGYTNSYAYSTVLNIGGTPTVAYTATDNSVMSVKITFAVEGANGVWEQFDVSAVIDSTGNDINFTVSNRVKRDNAIPDTVVTAAVDGSDRITISLNLDGSQTGGWSSFDAVEFGLMAG